jgi:hypothetical protein
MAHTSTYEVNHYVYEKMTPEKRLDHWNKRFQLGSIAFLQDEELMERLGGQKQFLDIGQRSFNSYTFTRFHELVDRYGLVTGDRADCIEGVNLATIWTTYYHLPEDILTLDPDELWVRKYDCSAGWLDPPLCSWCWGMKSAILRVINPRLSFAWTKTAGLGDRCDGGSLCEGFYKLGEIDPVPEDTHGVTTAADFEPQYLKIYDEFKQRFNLRRWRYDGPRACDDPGRSHTPLEQVRQIVMDISRRTDDDIEEAILAHLCLLAENFREICSRIGEEQTIRGYKRAATRFWSQRYQEIADEVGLVRGPEADCIEASALFFIESHYNEEPEDRVELSEDRVVVRRFHCKPSSVQPPFCDMLRSQRSAGLAVINPSITFRATKCIGLGDSCCEGVYERGGDDSGCSLKERFPDMD